MIPQATQMLIYYRPISYDVDPLPALVIGWLPQEAEPENYDPVVVTIGAESAYALVLAKHAYQWTPVDRFTAEHAAQFVPGWMTPVFQRGAQ